MWFVMALLVIATGLVFLDMFLRAREAWTKEQIRRAFRARVQRDLARDRLIHDRVQQMPLPEEADDYLDIMAMRDAWQSRVIEPSLADNRQ